MNGSLSFVCLWPLGGGWVRGSSNSENVFPCTVAFLSWLCCLLFCKVLNARIRGNLPPPLGAQYPSLQTHSTLGMVHGQLRAVHFYLYAVRAWSVGSPLSSPFLSLNRWLTCLTGQRHWYGIFLQCLGQWYCGFTVTGRGQGCNWRWTWWGQD